MKNFFIWSLLTLTLPLSGWAQFTFTTNNGAITITGYTGSGGNVVIPAANNGYPVTGIGASAFYQAYVLTNVTLANSITNIGASAFSLCTNLTSIVFSTNLISIGDFGFSRCYNLATCSLPNSVITLGTQAFSRCNSLTNILLSSRLASIPDHCFYFSQNLLSIVIPSGVTNISTDAFQNCTNLRSATLLSGLTSIGNGAFEECYQLDGIMIPDSVTSLGGYAFLNCTNLKSITIPNGVRTLAARAFENCTNMNGIYFKGNAPGIAFPPVFSNDTKLVVYYLPGTTGWTSALDGRLTMLWNPTIPTTAGSLGINGNQFGFSITGTPNIPIVVESSSNLNAGAWTPVQNCTLTNGSIFFTDAAWTNYSNRTYRIRSP